MIRVIIEFADQVAAEEWVEDIFENEAVLSEARITDLASNVDYFIVKGVGVR